MMKRSDYLSLNPSFSGCPALGFLTSTNPLEPLKVLILLLVDVPLWGKISTFKHKGWICLNPSFSGCPALGKN